MKKSSMLMFFVLSSACYAALPTDQRLERGKYIFNSSGCMNCHSPDRNQPLTGGKKMVSSFGTFYTPNISSDKNFGIGSWTDEQFLTAVKRGISPSGEYYYPSFSFASYSKLTDEDVLAMRAYMNTLPPFQNQNRPHELKFPFNQRKILLAWRALNFRKDHVSIPQETVFKYQGTFRPHKDKTKEWNNGAYLVEASLHCTECHTPRNKLGGLEENKWMAGGIVQDEDEPAANITSDKETGLGKWGRDDWKTFLTDGSKPDGDEVSGEMYRIIKYGTSKLSASDLDDVITYLQDLKAVHNTAKK
ncbi:MAG: c-type cytochrome [Bacteriovorax sp.]